MSIKPTYLFADSRLLFGRAPDGFSLRTIRNSCESARVTAAYLGASNGDDPQYYSIFAAAMEGIGINEHRMILSTFSREDAAFINEAEIILLAGGDVQRGWQAFVKNGLVDVLTNRYRAGATLIGISAGAVQLGLFGWRGGELASENLTPTLGLVPFIVGVHEEEEEWKTLKQMLRVTGPNIRGIGIPAGAGLILHEDRSIEPIRGPLYEFSQPDKEIVCSRLFNSKLKYKEHMDPGI